MENTDLLFLLLIVLTIYYLNLKSKINVTEGFKKKREKNSEKSGKSKKSGKSGKSGKGGKLGKSGKSGKSKKQTKIYLDNYNSAILQIISKASDDSSVNSTTDDFTSGLRAYLDDAFKTNLRLTDAGAALSEDEFQDKADEGIKKATTKNTKDFTKWFDGFVTPDEESLEASE